jgi:hypothetical protein
MHNTGGNIKSRENDLSILDQNGIQILETARDLDPKTLHGTG